MQLGFETIGNATLIAFEGRPVLATDPWIAGAPYFGSWGLSHAIPPEQMAANMTGALLEGIGAKRARARPKR